MRKPASNQLSLATIPVLGQAPRDIVARKSITDLQTRTGQWDNYRPNLMDGLTATSPPVDSDGDGMPNSWELQNGLNPNDGNDHTTVMPSGYTAIEEYINGLASDLFSNAIFIDGFENN